MLLRAFFFFFRLSVDSSKHHFCWSPYGEHSSEWGTGRRLSMTYQKNPRKADWSPATLETSKRRMWSLFDYLLSWFLWSQYCKVTLNCTGISRRMLSTGMAAHGAGQDLGVSAELGHPCSRCTPSTEIQKCAIDPAAPQTHWVLLQSPQQRRLQGSPTQARKWFLQKWSNSPVE